MSSRPDPDALLARARQDEEARSRGRLRIYFGASAGVGKTYAMLVAGRRLAEEGRDVLIGIVETHGRAETEALLTDSAGVALPSLPRARLVRERAGGTEGAQTFEEFDLDAALARKPQLILVDELAHSNATGSRHAKRWQDVDELLAAGIDVFTTLNVQHLDSLNDVVGGITGIRVWETVPDTFFDRADEVVLVDIPADELLKRLTAGKVYLPAQAERAARNFFRKGNLIALREIALRRTADRVEDDVQAYRDERSIDRLWATEAALLCCVGPDAGAERVVRAAARLAKQLDVGWQAVYVETPRLQRRAAQERERILRVLSLAQQLGATTEVLSGSEVAEAVCRYARQHNLSRLVFGRSERRPWWRRWIGESTLAERIAILAPEINLLVVGHAASNGETTPVAAPSPVTLRSSDEHADPVDAKKRMRGKLRYVYPTLLIAAITGAALPLANLLHPTNIAMLYLLAVTVLAIRAGRGSAVFAAFLAVAAFDFFFVPPRFSFAVGDVQYILTLGTMLTIALVIGTLASNLRYQVRVAEHREERSRSLYEIARDLSRALKTADVVAEARDVVGRTFQADVHVLLPMGDGPLGARLDIPRSLANASGFEPAIAQWAYEHGVAAGAGTDTLSGSAWLFLPLQTPIGARGVLALRPARRRLLMIPEQRRLLETLAALIGIAIERTHYVEIAQGAIIKVESERLRNSILSALSHDLRTPIAALAVSTETLAMTRDRRSESDRVLIDAMQGDVRRMGVLVENLLDMARIESGDVTLRRNWHSIEETIGTALAATGRELAAHHVRTAVPVQLPLVEYDAVLIERVIYNLLENAAKYSLPGSTVLIEASASPRGLTFAIEDDGPGLSDEFTSSERIETLFDKFTRGVEESPTSGIGLGLAICRAIVEAHGGTISVETRRSLPSRAGGRGFRVAVVLPRTEPPAVEGEHASELQPVLQPAGELDVVAAS